MNENELKKIYKKIMRNSIAFWIYLIFLIFTVIYILSIKYYTLQVIRLFNLPQDYVFKFFWEPNFNNTNFTLDTYFNVGFFTSAFIAIVAYLYGVISAIIIYKKAHNDYNVSKLGSGLFLFNAIFTITGFWIIFYLISWTSLYKEFKNNNL